MNRRDLFKGIGAGSLVACTSSENQHYAYTIGTPQCSKCLSVMPIDNEENGIFMSCQNCNCENYLLRFIVPQTRVYSAGG